MNEIENTINLVEVMACAICGESFHAEDLSSENVSQAVDAVAHMNCMVKS